MSRELIEQKIELDFKRMNPGYRPPARKAEETPSEINDVDFRLELDALTAGLP